MPSNQDPAIKGFLSYAHRNETRVARLKEHLSPLTRNRDLELWSDHIIQPGETWEKAIGDQLAKSQLVLLCVSSAFLASDYIYEKELKLAIARQQRGECYVVPVILEYCQWRVLKIGGLTLGDLQAVPTGGKPIEGWRPAGRGDADAAGRIMERVRSLQLAKPTAVR